MEQGCIAVAMVQRQVMVVRTSQTQKQRNNWLDVHTFRPLGNRVFLPSTVPQARIASSDILSIFPSSDNINVAGGMLELPPQAYSEYIELSSRMQEKYERLFTALRADTGKAPRRR